MFCVSDFEDKYTDKYLFLTLVKVLADLLYIFFVFAVFIYLDTAYSQIYTEETKAVFVTEEILLSAILLLNVVSIFNKRAPRFHCNLLLACDLGVNIASIVLIAISLSQREINNGILIANRSLRLILLSRRVALIKLLSQHTYNKIEVDSSEAGGSLPSSRDIGRNIIPQWRKLKPLKRAATSIRDLDLAEK